MKKEDQYKIKWLLDSVQRWLCGELESPAMPADMIEDCAKGVNRLMTPSRLSPYFETESLWVKLSDITLMMGQVARRIASPDLGELVTLRNDFMSAHRSMQLTNRVELDVQAFTARLETCMKRLSTELAFFDPAELLHVWATRPRKARDDEDGYYLDTTGLSADDANAKSRDIALSRLKSELGDDFSDKALSLADLFNAYANAFESRKASALPALDRRTAQHVLGADTHMRVQVYSASGAEGLLTWQATTWADTDFTGEQASAIKALEHDLAAALGLARHLGSETMGTLEILLDDFTRHKDAFPLSRENITTSGRLNNLIAQLDICHRALLKDLASAENAANTPVPVTLDKKSGKIIENAVHAKRSEQELYSDEILSELFDCHPNTIANWRRGRAKPPAGFQEAFRNHNKKAMVACAKAYCPKKKKSDAMNTKHVVRNVSDEQLYRETL